MLKQLLSNSKVATTVYFSICHLPHTLQYFTPFLTNKIYRAQDVTKQQEVQLQFFTFKQSKHKYSLLDHAILTMTTFSSVSNLPPLSINTVPQNSK